MNRYCRLSLAVAALALAVRVTHACDDPVFQYALTNWPRGTYQVLQYHRPESSEGTGAEQVFAQAPGGGSANYVFHQVDVAKLGEAPPGSLAGRAWDRHKEKALPFYVVVAPNGKELFAGPMTAEDAEGLVRSGQRSRLAKDLAGGKEGLLLLLTGSDDGENGKARQTVESAIEHLKEAGHDVGWMVVKRGDPDEAWLVRQLLAAGRDLASIKRPMLFGVFGKGYVLEPYTGDRITPTAVDTLVAFFKGPCTCDVMYEVSGLDLLTDFDWRAAVSDEPAPDERPYYSLLIEAPLDEPEEVDAAPAPGTGPVPAGPEPSGGTLTRNVLIAAGCLVVIATVTGWLVLKARPAS